MIRKRDIPLAWYILATGTWFASHGIQHVMFAWLVTMVLLETPVKIGVAQMALLIPAMLFMLIGGVVTDRVGGKKVALAAQSLAVIPIFGLAILLITDRLSFEGMIFYAIMIGILQAFVTPARDSLLNAVAYGKVQRTVIKATLMQFVAQMIGFALASSADSMGGAFVIIFQGCIVALGAYALRVLPVHQTISPKGEGGFMAGVIQSIREGAQTVWEHRTMRNVVWQNIAMGICFMGSYIVTIPLLIRERYEGSAFDLAVVNLFNSTGLVITITLLLVFSRGIQRQGRALLLAHGLGALFLMIGGFGVDYWIFAITVFFWGACGGVAMSMSRTIMQESAPENQRGRVMGIFSLSFMGSGPIGAILWGTTAEYFGPEITLLTANVSMFCIVAGFSMYSALWRMKSEYVLN